MHNIRCTYTHTQHTKIHNIHTYTPYTHMLYYTHTHICCIIRIHNIHTHTTYTSYTSYTHIQHIQHAHTHTHTPSYIHRCTNTVTHIHRQCTDTHRKKLYMEHTCMCVCVFNMQFYSCCHRQLSLFFFRWFVGVLLLYEYIQVGSIFQGNFSPYLTHIMWDVR